MSAKKISWRMYESNINIHQYVSKGERKIAVAWRHNLAAKAKIGGAGVTEMACLKIRCVSSAASGWPLSKAYPHQDKYHQWPVAGGGGNGGYLCGWRSHAWRPVIICCSSSLGSWRLAYRHRGQKKRRREVSGNRRNRLASAQYQWRQLNQSAALKKA
jgi:hypothetical protein